VSQALQLTLQWTDWANLFFHYLLLSLLSIGGAITAIPDMHRYLVSEHAWLTDTQFAASIALAQASPGPNVLFVALLGWHVGLNAGGTMTALVGVCITMVGILLPSTTITYLAAKWGHKNRERPTVRAFKQGMAPIVVALVVAAGWILADANGRFDQNRGLWLLTIVTAYMVFRTRIHLLWLLGAGALLGWFGLI
jgi:chromate transporter